MKKYIPGILFLFLFMLQLATPASAQRFKAGLAGGFNLSQLDGDKLIGFNQIGVNAGGRVAAVLSNRWELGVEMLYSQQGSSRVRTDDPSSIYDKIRLNFVEAPVTINFREWKFLLTAGFSYSRLINFKVVDYTGEDITDNQTYNPDIFSMIFGATYNFNEHFGIEVRWSRYLNDLQADESDNKLIGRTIGIRGVYMF
jgi:hypothetical protein